MSEKMVSVSKLKEGVEGNAPNGMFISKCLLYQILDSLAEEPGFDLIAHLRRQCVFSEKAFGPGERTAGLLDHIRKELEEVAANPELEEWIDIVILALDGAWRIGATPEQIAEALEAKQTKNEGREWPDWRTAESGKAIEHIKDPVEEPKPEGAIAELIKDYDQYCEDSGLAPKINSNEARAEYATLIEERRALKERLQEAEAYKVIFVKCPNCGFLKPDMFERRIEHAHLAVNAETDERENKIICTKCGAEIFEEIEATARRSEG